MQYLSKSYCEKSMLPAASRVACDMAGAGAGHDDGDEADGAKGAEVRRHQSECAPQQRGGCKGGTGHMVLPREEHAGA